MRLALLGTALAVVCLTACGGEQEPAASEPAMAELTGTVVYRERIALRMDAVITVRLNDVSLMDVPSVLLAEQKIEARGKSVPIPYSLTYDPARISERNSYAVRAEIRDGQGNLLWTTDTVIPVLTRGAPSDQVEIRVVQVSR